MLRKRLPVKTLDDGRAFLNLGCGPRMNRAWNNVDFDAYARLTHHPALARLLRSLGVLSADRYRRLADADPDIVVADLRRGIPFPDGSFDAVYSSHVLPHLDREAVPSLLRECRRVLKDHGTLRLVVPDLLAMAARYLASAAALRNGDPSALEEHEAAIWDLFELFVRRESYGTSRQPALVRRLERLIRGSPERRGELYCWMYDEYTLSALLADAGFADLEVQSATGSRIEGWASLNLDINADGSVHKPRALYLEGTKNQAGE